MKKHKQKEGQKEGKIDNTLNKMVHNIFYDNNVYRPIIRSENTNWYNQLYDSTIEYVPELNNGEYNIYFTWSSLFEAIGDGNFLEKYEPKLNLNDFCIPDNIGEADADVQEEILGNLLNSAYSYTNTHFLKHPEISKNKLLSKIDSQLRFSKNSAAKEIIENTIIRYRDYVVNDFEKAKASLALHLTWDAICAFPFIHLNQKAEDCQRFLRSSTRKINEWLLRIFHDRRAEGNDLSSFRLVDKIQKELLTDSMFIKKIEQEQKKSGIRINIPGLLKSPLNDLCDADYIHFATCGMDQRAGLIFTADSKDVVYTRLILQLSIMRFLCSADKSKLKLFPGIVFIVDPKLGVIIEKIDVFEIKEGASIKIIIDELEKGIASFATF